MATNNISTLKSIGFKFFFDGVYSVTEVSHHEPFCFVPNSGHHIMVKPIQSGLYVICCGGMNQTTLPVSIGSAEEFTYTQDTIKHMRNMHDLTTKMHQAQLVATELVERCSRMKFF